MNVYFDQSFDNIARDLHRDLLEAPEVDVGEWHAMDVKGNDMLVSRELREVIFSCFIPGMSREAVAHTVKPNLPWADEHFAERVSGDPLNPPPSHVNWPWASANEKHQTMQEPEVDERDWAYLAALIDGDGYISMWENRGKVKPRVAVSQSLENGSDYLRSVQRTFNVGNLHELRRETTTPAGREVKNNMLRWTICSKHEVEWVLRHTIPYLRLKRDRAQEALTTWEATPAGPGTKQWKASAARFSHSYPERMWPTRGHGVRFPYGNLDNVVNLLARSPYTRQAVLPIWFPEDLYAADVRKERVPCTLMYHWLLRDGRLHVAYDIRSCDFVRYFRDDVYFAMRLTQWIIVELRIMQNHRDEGYHPVHWVNVEPGDLTMRIGSLHVFNGDLPKLRRELEATSNA